MKKELLKRADWNIIVVDWAGGSLPLYTQATANTRLVGLEISYFINYLIVISLLIFLLLDFHFLLYLSILALTIVTANY